KPFNGIAIAFAIAGLLVVAYFAGRHYFAPAGHETPTAIATPGAARIGGAFNLVDDDGKAVTDVDFRGRYMLVYFGFTYCPDVCPTSLNRNMQALDLLDEAQAEKVQPILISVDPERDRPAHLKEYVGHFSPTMRGLTGTPEQVAAAAKAYGVYYAKMPNADDSASYLVDHTSITYLMGPDGRFVQHFRHDLPPNEMAEQLRKLLG
ncbi:MAG TPA: SCO family protein, partial [Rhodospirillales bacterium]|nr:SCO family protein [Rhodospirillales bacterium]